MESSFIFSAACWAEARCGRFSLVDLWKFKNLWQTSTIRWIRSKQNQHLNSTSIFQTYTSKHLMETHSNGLRFGIAIVKDRPDFFAFVFPTSRPSWARKLVIFALISATSMSRMSLISSKALSRLFRTWYSFLLTSHKQSFPQEDRSVDRFPALSNF